MGALSCVLKLVGVHVGFAEYPLLADGTLLTLADMHFQVVDSLESRRAQCAGEEALCVLKEMFLDAAGIGELLPADWALARTLLRLLAGGNIYIVAGSDALLLEDEALLVSLTSMLWRCWQFGG